MKRLTILLAIFGAGLLASTLAIAKPPPGKGNGNGHRVSSTSISSTSTTTTTSAKKVALCHRTGNGSFRRIVVSKNAVKAHIRHGDHVAGPTECAATTTSTTTTTTP